MQARMKRRMSRVLWIVIMLFMIVVITFPKWIAIFYPQPHREIVISAAQQYDVDPYLVFAIIRAESGYRTTAQSPVGARGLMQIMPETGAWIAKQQGITDFSASDLHDPQVNISFGCWYLASLNKEFSGRLPVVIAAYNAGSGKVRDWMLSGQWDGSAQNLTAVPYTETQQYVKNVLSNYQAYKAIYE